MSDESAGGPIGAKAAPSFFEGLVGRFSDLMGERASYSTFHFASFQEGMRIGSDFRSDALPEMLRHMDGILGQKSRLVEHANKHIVIQVRDSGLLGVDDPIMQGIAIGFLEGGLHGCLGRRLEGAITENGPPVVLRFSPPLNEEPA